MSEQQNVLSRRAFLYSGASMAAILAASSFPISAFAITSTEKKAEAAAALSKLEAMESRLSAASNNYVNAESEQLAARERMKDAQNNIDNANGEISKLQDHLSTRARNMYRSGSASFLDMLLGSTSFQAFSSNWTLLNNMNEKDAEAVAQTKILREEVIEQKRVYTEQEAVAAEKKSQAAAAQQEAKALVTEMQNTYNTLSAEAQQLFNQEQAARAAALEAQNNARNNNNGGGNSGTEKKTTTKKKTSAPQGGYGSNSIERAKSQLGVDYVYGAGTPGVGWDCSHLVCWALGIPYGTTATLINRYDEAEDPRPGDIAWRPGHVGLYIGGGQMIHAPHTGDVVKYGSTSGMTILRPT